MNLAEEIGALLDDSRLALIPCDPEFGDYTIRLGKLYADQGCIVRLTEMLSSSPLVDKVYCASGCNINITASDFALKTFLNCVSKSGKSRENAFPDKTEIIISNAFELRHLYALSQSIFEYARIENLDIPEESPIDLVHLTPQDRQLLRHLAYWPSLSFSHVNTYLLNLEEICENWWRSQSHGGIMRVIEKNDAQATRKRIAMVMAVAITIKEAFTVIGECVPEELVIKA